MYIFNISTLHAFDHYHEFHTTSMCYIQVQYFQVSLSCCECSGAAVTVWTRLRFSTEHVMCLTWRTSISHAGVLSWSPAQVYSRETGREKAPGRSDRVAAFWPWRPWCRSVNGGEWTGRRFQKVFPSALKAECIYHPLLNPKGEKIPFVLHLRSLLWLMLKSMVKLQPLWVIAVVM